MNCRHAIPNYALCLKITMLCLLIKPFTEIAIARSHLTNINAGDTIVYRGQPVICPGGKLLLTLANLPDNATIKWFNTISPNPVGFSSSYEVTTAGTYFATALSSGVSYTYPSLTVTAASNPVAGFTFSGQGGCSSTAVQFTNTSQGKGLTYSWNFGDVNSHKLNSSTDANPSHLFVGIPGNGSETFVVTLTVTNASGCTDIYSQNITLLQTPDVSLTGPAATTFNNQPYFVSCTDMPTEFTFTNVSKTNNTGYNIYWAGGSPQTFVNKLTSIKHVYRRGFFIMFYTVYGANGCSKVQKYRIFVGRSPMVSFQPDQQLSVCTGVPVIIKLNSSASNSQGTTYTATYSDGTVNTYSSLPDTLMHTFHTNSLAQIAVKGGIAYNNAYSVIVTAINPCGTASDTLAPIYVSDPQKAQLINIGSDIACVNTNIHLKNNSVTGYSISKGVSSPNKLIWKIIPNSGFLVSPSSLGTDSGSKDVSKWVSGTKNLNITFTQPGEYKITLLTGNGQCGVDSDSRRLCINPSPEAAFDLSVDNGCYPQSVTVRNRSNSPLCSTVQYQWTITYDNMGCTEYSSNVSFINGTTSTSAEPQLMFSGAGLYTVSLTSSFPISGCISAVYSRQILIKAKPAVTLNLPNSIYVNQGLIPKVKVEDCFQTDVTNYKWAFAGASDTTSSLSQPDTIYYSSPGKYNIVLDVTNECGTTEVTQMIEVIKKPTISIPNAFTPNNDGKNDCFGLKYWSRITSMQFEIFNRWGQRVFFTSDPTGCWDGTYNGVPQPPGGYIYQIRATTICGTATRKGMVMLIR